MSCKILFVASVYVHISNFHLPYIKGLADRGYEVDVACKDCAETIDGARKTINIAFEKNYASLGNFLLAKKLRSIIKENQYDLIICHTSLAAFFTRLALLGMRNRPAVCNMVHGYLFDDDSRPLKKIVLSAAEKLTAPVTDLVITMNEYDRKYATRHRLGKQIAYVNGVGLNPKKFDTASLEKAEAKAALGFRDDAFVLLYAAEFSKRKSQHVLIEAMMQLPQNVVLALPGTGLFLDQCKILAQQLGVADRVCFPGHCKDISRWLCAADIVVTASRSEGCPFSVMEGMHFGLPIVASNVKGHQELVEDGVNGYLYPYGDCSAFAGKIRTLLENPEQVKVFRQASKTIIQKHYLDQVYPAIMALYENVANCT